MKKLIRGYRKISRYSTGLLLLIVIGLGLYTWLNRTVIYYQSYCEKTEGEKLEYARFDNSYECDQSLIQARAPNSGQCKKMGCRKVVE